MKTPIIGVMFISAVLFLTAAASLVVTAQNSTADAYNLGDQEKLIIHSITNSTYDPDNLAKAQELLELQKAQNRKEIAASVNASYNKLKASGELPIVTDHLDVSGSTVATVEDSCLPLLADHHDEGRSVSGAMPYIIDQAYVLNKNLIRNKVLVGPAGVGSAGAWGWVGYTFMYDGKPGPANVVMIGHIYGLTTALAGGASNSEIDLYVYDHTDVTEYSTSIYHQGAGPAGWYEVNEDFNKGVTVFLYPGHVYTMCLQVDGSTSVYGAGEAGSNFFDGGAGARFTSLKF